MIWKTIPQFKNYEVSEDGQVRNIKTGRILKPYDGKRGYYTYGLRRDGEDKAKPVAAHTLVAIAFLSFKPQGSKTVIDHVDGNKHNNHYTNLEIVSGKENCIRAIKTGLHDCYKQVFQYDKDGKLVATYPSVKEAAAQTNIDHRFIASCANASITCKTAKNFVFSYIPLDPETISKLFTNHTTGKQVLCIETGISYDTISLAAEAIGISASKISLVCKGKRNKAGGYHWKYL